MGSCPFQGFEQLPATTENVGSAPGTGRGAQPSLSSRIIDGFKDMTSVQVRPRALSEESNTSIACRALRCSSGSTSYDGRQYREFMLHAPVRHDCIRMKTSRGRFDSLFIRQTSKWAVGCQSSSMYLCASDPSSTFISPTLPFIQCIRSSAIFDRFFDPSCSSLALRWYSFQACHDAAANQRIVARCDGSGRVIVMGAGSPLERGGHAGDIDSANRCHPPVDSDEQYLL